ncbi:MAG: hypothetical protein ISP33_04975 [Ilumatobacteraceae bacterium]|nr:hypothetical protein [Ilumatobacteraceae bacterium]
MPSLADIAVHELLEWSKALADDPHATPPETGTVTFASRHHADLVVVHARVDAAAQAVAAQLAQMRPPQRIRQRRETTSNSRININA